jgi:hypothetical protein
MLDVIFFGVQCGARCGPSQLARAPCCQNDANLGNTFGVGSAFAPYRCAGYVSWSSFAP